VLGTDEAEQV